MSKHSGKKGGWGNVYQPPRNPEITKFELEVRKLGLSESDWEHSIQLRAWVGKYKHHRFVPEWLLVRWDMHKEDLPTYDIRDQQD
jgi:hypothetical protein